MTFFFNDNKDGGGVKNGSMTVRFYRKVLRMEVWWFLRVSSKFAGETISETLPTTLRLVSEVKFSNR